ncbi:MAG: late competence development ComFB family protein [Aeromonas sp.]
MKLDSDIHNFYEYLVLQALREEALAQHLTPDQLADLCCLTLNQLPAHYIRHNVDMIYFLGPDKRQEMEEKVRKALKLAMEKLSAELA